MAKIQMINIEGNPVSEIEVNDNIFNCDVNEHVVYLVVKNILANRRQGTHSAKTRSEVRGGGRKPWRQKGTGRARQGSIRSPQWKGGGVVFAPKPRDYSYKLPRSTKQAALRSALTSKFEEGKLVVVDNITFDAPKTKDMVNFISNVGAVKPLIVTEKVDKNVYISARNLQKTAVTFADLINVYDIVKHDTLVVSEAALARIEEVFI